MVLPITKYIDVVFPPQKSTSTNVVIMFWGSKFWGGKKFLTPPKLWNPKHNYPQRCWLPNILTHQKIWPKKNFDLLFFTPNKFGPQSILMFFWPTNNYATSWPILQAETCQIFSLPKFQDGPSVAIIVTIETVSCAGDSDVALLI